LALGAAAWGGWFSSSCICQFIAADGVVKLLRALRADSVEP
jgi:hypothetical protein